MMVVDVDGTVLVHTNANELLKVGEDASIVKAIM